MYDLEHSKCVVYKLVNVEFNSIVYLCGNIRINQNPQSIIICLTINIFAEV